jgi:predicted nuclease of restriction endonuclease-like (RecB) superfamily
VANLPSRRSETLPSGYGDFLNDIKKRVTAARSRAMLAANAIVITSYWEIGRGVLEREEQEGWGARVVDRLAKDLRREFPDMTGLSPRNLRYMKKLASVWPAKLPQAVATLPWGHVRLLLDKLDDTAEREWYASGAVEHGWSRAMLETQIASDLRGRKGAALTSFDRALPSST